jgi:homoserine O-acetyltransferase
MTEDAFDSSDAGRGGGPLKHGQTVTFAEAVELERGGRLPDVVVTYETYGQLNDDKSNAVLVCHGLSGDSHVAGHDAADDPGWWDVCVGPGKAIDTDKYFVICPNVLGGCRGTTGPGSENPQTGEPYGADFPTITVHDMVDVQRMLIDHLGIDRLLAVVGGSMGGQLVLSWALRHRQRVAGLIPLATSPRVSSQSLAFDVVGRNAIMHDASFHNGQYYDKEQGPAVGLALARMLAHITYLSRESMDQKFDATRYQPRDVPVAFEKEFSVGSYLGYQGAKFVDRFDANSYIAITMAIDLFDLGADAEQLTPLFAGCPGRWLVVSFSSDWLFPSGESKLLARSLIAGDRPVSYCNVPSSSGHDAFLLADDVALYGELIRAFLANLSGDAASEDRTHRHGRGSIFAPERLDYDHIVELIEPGSSVLDLGCGSGALLGRLDQRGHTQLMGVDIDEQAVLESVRGGHDVVHADLERDLGLFEDGQFDYVVLSRTLQAVLNVEQLMNEMLRVGRKCIVTFPNFAYHKLRTMLTEQGRAPEAPGVLRHKWYNTPNLRFFSIADFEGFCDERRVQIHVRQFLDTEAGEDVVDDPNRNADLAIFVVSR